MPSPPTRVALLAAWFGATLVTARVLGPVAFGLYTLCQNSIRLFTGCFGEPLDMAVMRSAPLHLDTDRPRALAVVRAAFWLRASLGLLPVLPALFMPAVLSWLVFGQTDHRRLALLTAIGIGGDLLLRSTLGFFQVSRRFGPFLLTDVVWQLGRSIVMVTLAAAGVLSADGAVSIYIIAPYVCVRRRPAAVAGGRALAAAAAPGGRAGRAALQQVDDGRAGDHGRVRTARCFSAAAFPRGT